MFKLKTEGQRRFTENLTVKLQKLKSDIFTKEKKKVCKCEGFIDQVNKKKMFIAVHIDIQEALHIHRFFF